jgi:hypothetical protein
MTVIVESQSSMSACDKLTMDTMINMGVYSKYMARKETDTKIRSSETKSERRFYKKRILELTKQLIKNPTHTNDSSVITACNAYINACIVHFKFVDLSDTLQMEHVTACSVAEPSSISGIADDEGTAEQHDVIINIVNQIDTAFLSESDDVRNIKKISIPEKNVLEQLFISPELKMKSKSDTTTTTTTTKHIPRIIEVDFKDRQLKTKCIKKSKGKNKDSSDSTEKTE